MLFNLWNIFPITEILGIEHDPCSDQYGGTHPLSEPEVEQLTKFINSNIPEGSIKIYIALHSAAQAILLPWTHTRELPVDYDRLMYVAKAFADAVFSRFYTKYRYGTSANILSMINSLSYHIIYYSILISNFPKNAKSITVQAKIGLMQWKQYQ